ncbi:MAG: hypothetical protein DSY90_06190 [Deltaproteobacteria bacterium]|nr:MAG: hypothetical protein DSY90_06190 [Deltaproteobacteria bacterium]
MADRKSYRHSTSSACCGDGILKNLPAGPENKSTGDIPCCGQPSYPPSGPFEKPGYQVSPFVEDFMETAAGPVPRIRPNLSWTDRVGTVLTRIGIGRDHNTVSPGLYAIGIPGPDDPVLVTSKFKGKKAATCC